MQPLKSLLFCLFVIAVGGFTGLPYGSFASLSVMRDALRFGWVR